MNRWSVRLAVSLLLAVAVGSAVGLLGWLVRSDAPAVPLAAGQTAQVDAWDVTSGGVRTVDQLPGADGEPVRAAPGTVLVLVEYQVGSDDPAVLAETICDVVLVSADGGSRWEVDGSAVYRAFGDTRLRSCYREPGDAPGAAAGTGFRVLTSAEVPASRADGITAELSLFHNTDTGGRLRVHGDERRLSLR